VEPPREESPFDEAREEAAREVLLTHLLMRLFLDVERHSFE
jgi:hypothetical protein